jgi:DNA topoisomerase VI subunit A
VDWDPYGMDIALNYYNGLGKRIITLLAATSGQLLDNGWLGTKTLELNISDRKKIDALCQRLGMSQNPFFSLILRELNFMHNFNAKMELDIMETEDLLRLVTENQITKNKICVDRESNPDRLLGRQAC